MELNASLHDLSVLEKKLLSRPNVLRVQDMEVKKINQTSIELFSTF